MILPGAADAIGECVGLFLRLMAGGCCGIEGCDGGKIDNIAHLGSDMGEVDRLVQTHLDRANGFAYAHLEDHAVGRRAGREIGKHEGVDILAVETGEGVGLVAQTAVEGKEEVHLAVDGQIGIHLAHLACNRSHHVGLRLTGRAAEVGVAHESHYGCVCEILYRVAGRTGNVEQRFGVGIAVDLSVGEEESTLLVCTICRAAKWR